MDEEINSDGYYHDIKVNDTTCKIIEPCIDLECKGIDRKGVKMYKVNNSLLELKTCLQ